MESVVMTNPACKRLDGYNVIVRASIDGAKVAIETDYPFGDVATITATPTASADLPVYVRIPGFAEHATVAV